MLENSEILYEVTTTLLFPRYRGRYNLDIFSLAAYDIILGLP
jgi:hypothetical protein